MPTSEADFAVPSANPSGPITDPVRAKRKGVVAKAVESVRQALTPTEKEPAGIFDDEDAPDNQPAPAPSPTLSPELAAFAAKHGIPSNVRTWILSACKTEGEAVAKAHESYLKVTQEARSLTCVRSCEAKLESLLGDINSNIDEIRIHAAVLNLIRDSRNDLVLRLGYASELHCKRKFSELVEPSLTPFIARLHKAITDAEQRAIELDKVLAQLVPGLKAAEGHVSRQVHDFKSQFGHLNASRTNPLLVNTGIEHQFVQLAIEASNA